MRQKNTHSLVKREGRDSIRKHPEENTLLDSIKILNNCIKELSHQIKQISKDNKDFESSSLKSVNFPYVQQRFEHVQITIPSFISCILSVEEKKSQIQSFLERTCKKIFSIGFSLLKNGALDENQMQIFCSENIIGKIVKMIRQNRLNEGEIKIINDSLIKKILPYFNAKYSPQVRQPELLNFIDCKNNIEDEKNDIIYRSGVNFVLKETKNYNTQIMKLLNFIIDETNTEKKQFENNIKNIFSSQQNERKHFLVVRKFPKNIKKFSDYDIESGNLELHDPALIQIITQWCEQLQQKYERQSIMNRDCPYRMKNKTLKFLDKKWMTFILSGLLRKFYAQFPLSHRKKVMQHSYKSQSEYWRLETPKQLNILSQEQALVGNFSVFAAQDYSSYLKGYLNSLIHGIMMATQQFQKIIQHSLDLSEQISQYIKKRTRKSLQIIINKAALLKTNQAKNLTSVVPTLITMKILDIFQCRHVSNMKQIKDFYSCIEIMAKNNPSYLKIVKVDHQILEGRKNIIINMLYKNKMIVEIKFMINNDTDLHQKNEKFIQSSKIFRIFLNKLQKSRFGPINQICFIWARKDQRSHFFNKIMQQKNIRRLQPLNNRECHHQNNSFFDLPFKCHECDYYYSNCTQLSKHISCLDCDKTICFLCQFDKLTIEKKKSTLNLIRDHNLNQEFIYYKGQSQQLLLNSIPSNCSIININGSLKKWKKIVKVEDQTKVLLLSQENSQFRLILQLNKTEESGFQEKGKLQKLLMNSIITERTQQSSTFSLQKIHKNYITPHYLQSCFTTKDSSISIVGQQFQCSVFQKNGKPQNRQFLEKLNLSENKISDPHNIEIIAKTFPNMKQLTLNHNQLQQLPEAIGKMHELQMLNLTSNNIETLPADFAKLKSLSILNINQNKLKKIPNEIGSLKSLTTLDLSNNQLQQLPKQISNLNSLLSLYVSNNRLRDIPNQIGNLSSLTTLDISANQLQQFPIQISKLVCLETLDMSKNKLKKLPAEIRNLISLITLDLSNNQIQQLPKQIGNLCSLMIFYLSGNQLQIIPQEISSLTCLQILDISNNRLKLIPSQIGSLISLTKLHLSNNKLNNIPKQIGCLILLTQLFIFSNQIKQLPKQIKNLTNLNILKMFSNDVKGLPTQIDSLSSLEIFDISGNQLEEIPKEIGFLGSLKILDISYNKIRQLPTQIINLNQLNILKIQKNKINKLPQDLYSLKSLELTITEEQMEKQTQQKLYKKRNQGWKIDNQN